MNKALGDTALCLPSPPAPPSSYSILPMSVCLFVCLFLHFYFAQHEMTAPFLKQTHVYRVVDHCKLLRFRAQRYKWVSLKGDGDGSPCSQESKLFPFSSSCWHSPHSLSSRAKGYIIDTGRPIKVTSETAAELSIDLFITINFLSLLCNCSISGRIDRCGWKLQPTVQNFFPLL